MKNEKLARAISDIDEELIEEAHGDMLRRRMPLAKKLTAVAACFIAVLFTAVVWHRITAVGVSVYGLDIAERGSVMLAGDLPDNRMLISTYALDLKIPLTVSTVGSCNIEVSDGTIIYSDPATVTMILWSLSRTTLQKLIPMFPLHTTKTSISEIFPETTIKTD